MHEMGIIFTGKLGKNWIKSDTSEKNVFKSQFFSVLISQMGLFPLIPMKIVNCCKEKYKQKVKIRSIGAVFGLHLIPVKCQISKVSGGFAPSPDLLGGLQLGWAMMNCSIRFHFMAFEISVINKYSS